MTPEAPPLAFRPVLRVDVHHPAWRLHAAQVVTLQDDLVAEAGYRDPGQEPVHVRWAQPVDVLVSAPRRVITRRVG